MKRKKSKEAITDIEDDELIWLQDSYADTVDHAISLMDENEELRLENSKLVAEVANLRKQIETLSSFHEPKSQSNRSPEIKTPNGSIRQQISPSNSFLLAPSTQKVSKPQVEPRRLSLPDQIKLYQSLFNGRKDVYATRWENQIKGSSGYVPACASEACQRETGVSCHAMTCF